jgi:hypothetical protein
VRRGARRARGGVNRVVLCFLRNRGSCFFPISVEAGRNGSAWYFDWGEAIVAGARGRAQHMAQQRILLPMSERLREVRGRQRSSYGSNGGRGGRWSNM